MSLANQDFGFDPANPLIQGKTEQITLVIPGVAVADVSSAQWILANLSPEESDAAAPLVTKTDVAGITLSDVGGSLNVDITLDPTDTATLALIDETPFFHRLDTVRTGGEQIEEARGRLKLKPRV